MVPKSGLFQASFSTALLRSTALAIALIVQATPTLAAEPVTLSCRSDAGSQTYTLRINYATGLVEQIASNGKVYTGRAATATISQNAIVWSIDQPETLTSIAGTTEQTTEHWEGHIDRLSGTGWIQSYIGNLSMTPPVNITCRQATQKF